MNIVTILRLLIRHIKLLIIIPLTLAIMVFYLTKDMPQKYSSKAVIYTGIASGYSIESQENTRVDFFGTNNAFDNLIGTIKSRKTQEEVAIHLLAQHLLLEKGCPEVLSQVNLNKLNLLVPEYIKNSIKGKNNNEAIKILTNIYASNDTNFVYKLLSLSHPHYSFEALSVALAKRVQNSDLVEISFDSNDPGVCLNTLNILIEVFLKNYKQLKEVQTDNVAKYFQEQLNIAQEKLSGAEDNLLIFNQDNKIINYYEQTKFIAEQRESMEQEYYTEKMNLASAHASMLKAEQQLSEKEKVFLKSTEVLALRDSISSIYRKLNEILIFAPAKDTLSIAYKKLRTQASISERQLESRIEELYSIKTTTEGVPIKELLTQWLTSTIDFESGKAKVNVFDERILQFQKKYDMFAPLGAMIKRIEREINISEQQYLSVLYGLNLAKLKQQNIELSSSAKLVDMPYFPIKSEASKRKILVILAALVGFFLSFTGIILLEFFDSTLKNMNRFESQARIKPIGLYPFIPNNFKNIDYKKISTLSTNLLTQKLLQQSLLNKKEDQPFVILLFSTRMDEGKTFLLQKIRKKMELLNYNVSTIVVGADANFKNEETDIFNYKISTDKQFISQLKLTIDQLTINKIDFILIELPSILDSILVENIFNKADLLLLTAAAKRKWEEADNHAMDYLVDNFSDKLFGILNGAEISEMENFIGEIPKKRSMFRKWVKKIMLGRIFEKRLKS